MAVTASQFIQSVEASGLLEGADLSAARAQAQEADLDGQALAVQLVQLRKLTPYQAKQLLAGNTRGFFLEKYKILEPIGRGGMGLVFKAEHTMLSRIAAIKVLPRKAASDRESVARFRREACAAAQLEHENIVRVYDSGTQGEVHFIAMEFVQGQSLSKTIKSRGRLTARESASIIYQVAQGLDHAFSRGITHRDIKPSNILITPEGKAKILDMGLARVFGITAEEEVNQLSLTMSGTVVGTVDYVAPEQADDSHKADVRSDIYSLGCTLYECITGQVPFPGGTMMQKLMKHYRSNPTEIHELVSDVPDGLVAIVKRMMAKRAKHRFQRPSEVADALLSFMTDSSPNRSAGLGVMMPIPPKPVESSESQPQSTDATLTQRRDIEAVPDASKPTRPTVPLGTPGPRKKAAPVTPRRETVAEAADVSQDSRATPSPDSPTEKGPAAKPVTTPSPAPEKQRPTTGPAAPTEVDLAAMNSGSTVQARASSKPERRVQPAEVNEILEAIALAASESPPSAAADPSPTFSWTRTHTLVTASLASFVILVSATFMWFTSRPGILIVQCPDAYSSDLSSTIDAKSGRILVDGKPLPLTKQIRQEFRVSAGYHMLHVDLPDLNRVTERISIASGKPVVVELTATQDKIRQWGLKDLISRVDEKAGYDTSDADVATLLRDLNAFANKHRGPEVTQAWEQHSRFSWPADKLHAAKDQSVVTILNTPNSELKAILVVATLDTPQTAPSAVNCLAVSPDGRRVACGRADGKVQVWNVNDAPNFRALGDHEKPVIHVAFVAGGDFLTSVSTDRAIFWDVATGAQRSRIDFTSGQLVAAAQSGDGQTLACAFQDGHVSFYDAGSRAEKIKMSFTGTAESLAVSSVGTVLAYGGKEKVELREITTGRKIWAFNSPEIVAMNFSQDDQWLSLVDKSGTAKVRQVGARQFSVNVEPNCGLLAFSPAVRTVAAVFDGRTVRLLRIASGEILGAFEFDASIGAITQLAFAPDTRHIATADSKGTVRILRLDCTP